MENCCKKIQTLTVSFKMGGKGLQSHCDVEIDDPFVHVVGDVGALHAHVGDVNGAREQEENGQAGQQQAEHHRYCHVQLPGGETKRELRPSRRVCGPSCIKHRGFI